jgi:hypothetical protein
VAVLSESARRELVRAADTVARERTDSKLRRLFITPRGQKRTDQSQWLRELIADLGRAIDQLDQLNENSRPLAKLFDADERQTLQSMRERWARLRENLVLFMKRAGALAGDVLMITP